MREHLRARGFLRTPARRKTLTANKLPKTSKNPAYPPDGGYVFGKDLAVFSWMVRSWLNAHGGPSGVGADSRPCGLPRRSAIAPRRP
jgi:hypothetical protein